MEENGWFTRDEKKGQRERRWLGTPAGQVPHPFHVQVGQRASQAQAHAGCRAGVKLGVGIRQNRVSSMASTLQIRALLFSSCPGLADSFGWGYSRTYPDPTDSARFCPSLNHKDHSRKGEGRCQGDGLWLPGDSSQMGQWGR